MPDRRKLARSAVLEALQVRKKVGVPLWEPICVFDILDRLGIEVRFTDIPSLEGVYLPGTPPQVILSSLRPAGRRAFTAGHELAHHVFGHGEKLDEQIEQCGTNRKVDPEEFVADSFSGALLMPKVAVEKCFSLRDIDPSDPKPADAFLVAAQLGVGYSTLISHMTVSLRLLSGVAAKRLSRRKPRDLRRDILGRDCPENLIVADQHWTGRAIDTEVSDLIFLPRGCRVEGRAAEVIEADLQRTVVRALTPGIARITSDALA